MADIEYFKNMYLAVPFPLPVKRINNWLSSIKWSAPKRIYTSNIIWTEQVLYIYIFT